MNHPRYIDYGWLVLCTLLIALCVIQLLAGGFQIGFVLVIATSLWMLARSIKNLRGNRG